MRKEAKVSDGGALRRNKRRGQQSWRSLQASMLGAAVLGSLAITQPANADLKLCNSTSSRVGVAIGYRDPKGWATEGWWNIASQTCETLLKGTLSSRFYYVHAVDYDRGGEWAGKSILCTHVKAFTIRDIKGCAAKGYRPTGFFEVDTGNARDWTVRLTDPEADQAKN